jgi:hypothetical protein
VTSDDTPSIIDEVMAVGRNKGPGFLPWYMRLPEADLRQLEELRDRWRVGQVPMHKRALARAIVTVCQQRGHDICGIQGVEAWIGRRSH